MECQQGTSISTTTPLQRAEPMLKHACVKVRGPLPGVCRVTREAHGIKAP